MELTRFLPAAAVMAGVTYLVRAVPFGLIQRKITNRFLRSLLFYIPYAVLAAMTFPTVFYCTSDPLPSLVGTAAALVFAWRGSGMVSVALAACAAVGLTLLLQA
ncbi:MAG: AzlD domain-containing protein [Lachnospiraceae bacterium]|nr:AzlD domain-containing protein [Lachnospiraceae bacterium]